MANVAVTNTFTNGTTADAPQVNTNFSDLVTYINARNGGGTAWDALSVTGTSTLTGAVSCASTLAVTGAITATGGIVNLFGYRRPLLVWISTTAVDLENNTGTSNQTSIIFPDGTIRSVTEDTSSTNKYRRFLITATAEFTTGTEDSGLYSGLSEATNTWYAIYAVKSLIDATKFVLVGTTTLPLQANYATLNSNLGTNGWVYLGMIRNGDNAGATGDILAFRQTGALTIFSNSAVGNATTFNGTVLATSAGATGVTYTYTPGTGTTNIPTHLQNVLYGGVSGNAGNVAIRDSGNTIQKFATSVSSASAIRYFDTAASGIRFANGSSAALDLFLAGFHDPLLDGSHQVL